uniref:Endomucin n=1 Tax=Sciurus vulgaris TaxID=55149 RepID=A0A8D2B4V0_SCIVU
MQLLQVTTLFLLFSLCSCENNTDVSTTFTTASSSTVSTKEKPVLTAKTVSPPNSDTELSAETSLNGTTNSELSNTSLVPETVTSLTTAKSEELETTTQNVTKSELITTKGTVTNPPLSNATSTTQSSQNETESQSSFKTSAIPGTPENGNDQPQSDKESVKLLTVKTISNESGEHSAQGKTKN